MTRGQEVFLGVGLILLGVIWTIVASFNLKHDPAWLSVLTVSCISAGTGWYFVDKELI